MNIALLEFAERIRQSDCLETSLSHLNRQLEGLGFVYAKYAFAMVSADTLRQGDVVVAGKFCEEWEAFQRDRNDWIEHDHIAQHLAAHSTSITFAEVYGMIDAGRLSTESAFGHSAAREMGMAHGVAMPIIDGNPLARGGISLEASRTFTAQEFDCHLIETLPQIKMLAEVFHAHVNKSHMFDKSQLPSNREKECLIWLMNGLRTQEIAHRLGTHPKTVEKQLANVRRKLNARTNVQAAARALVFELLQP